LLLLAERIMMSPENFMINILISLLKKNTT
jgi:hypothetical protein